MLTPEQERLREAAKAATPGPWAAQANWDRCASGAVITSASGEIIADDGSAAGEYSQELNGVNATYIAAANPAAILDLLALVEKLQGEVKP
jgi:hypothetical protein